MKNQNHVIRIESRNGKTYTFKIKGDPNHFYNMVTSSLIYGYDITHVAKYMELMKVYGDLTIEQLASNFDAWLGSNQKS